MTITNIAYALALVVLYGITGFGPGFILGVIIGNLTGGRGHDPITRKHEQNIGAAAEHNAQWHPGHERWQSKQ